MRDYWRFDVLAYIKDYQANQVALQNLETRLEEMTPISGTDYSRERVQASPDLGGPVERQVLLRVKLQQDIKELRVYFRVFDAAFNQLSPEEQVIIAAYRDGLPDPIDEICYQLCVEKTRAYELRRIALDRFAGMVA